MLKCKAFSKNLYYESFRCTMMLFSEETGELVPLHKEACNCMHESMRQLRLREARRLFGMVSVLAASY